MTGYLTTHVLDTARGCPAAGLRIDLYRLEGEARIPLARVLTNADGRTDTPILPAEDFALGTYELVFHAGDYLDRADRTRHAPASEPASGSAPETPPGLGADAAPATRPDTASATASGPAEGTTPETPPVPPRFLDQIPIRFGINSQTHHHVPLLLANFSYATYKGS